MRVLHICSNYRRPLYHHLYDKLESNGLKQYVYQPAPKGAASKPEGRPEVDYSECYAPAERLVFTKKRKSMQQDLAVRYDFTQLDVIHAHTLFTDGCLALWAKREYGIPYLTAIRNTDVNAFLIARPWLRSLGIEIIRQSEKVIFISPSYRDTVIQRFVPKDMLSEIETKSVVVPNGINDLFLDNPPANARCSHNGLSLIEVGDINKNKNQLTVASACRELFKRGYDVRFRVVGYVKDRFIAKRLARYDFVELFSPMPQVELISMYRESDVFVMPSRHETFGLVYGEAMSQGLPVIYTQKQGFDGFFEDGKVGKAVPYDNPEIIANSIESCYINRDTYHLNNPQRATVFDWDIVSKRYLSLYIESLS